jgi:hypothetical protein
MTRLPILAVALKKAIAISAQAMVFLWKQGVTTTVGYTHNLFSRIKGWRDAAPLGLAMLCVSELKAVIGTACDISVQKRLNAS